VPSFLPKIKKISGIFMSPRLVFWVSSSIRALLIIIATGIAAYLWGAVTGLLLGFIAMSGLVLLQLFYLQRLADWLDNPASSRLPDGWGAWTDIFSRLYKSRRGDEKIRQS
jgi:two-component system phosphate regulon sensor histidine kinase PhoR